MSAFSFFDGVRRVQVLLASKLGNIITNSNLVDDFLLQASFRL